MSITCQAWSDCGRMRVTFDAVPYFRQCSASDVEALMMCGWRGDVASDEVAIFMADASDTCRSLFSFLEACPTQCNGDTNGFECSVDEDAALSWLQEHRPQLIADVLRSVHGDS